VRETRREGRGAGQKPDSQRWPPCQQHTLKSGPKHKDQRQEPNGRKRSPHTQHTRSHELSTGQHQMSERQQGSGPHAHSRSKPMRRTKAGNGREGNFHEHSLDHGPHTHAAPYSFFFSRLACKRRHEQEQTAGTTDGMVTQWVVDNGMHGGTTPLSSLDWSRAHGSQAVGAACIISYFRRGASSTSSNLFKNTSGSSMHAGGLRDLSHLVSTFLFPSDTGVRWSRMAHIAVPLHSRKSSSGSI
jgi:hypothetical protein